MSVCMFEVANKESSAKQTDKVVRQCAVSLTKLPTALHSGQISIYLRSKFKCMYVYMTYSAKRLIGTSKFVNLYFEVKSWAKEIESCVFIH